MNYLWLALKLYSFKSEIKLLLATFFFLIFVLPVLVVVVLTQTGIQEVSNVLVKAIPGSGVVQAIFDNKTIEGPFYWPVTGKFTLEFGAIDLPYQPFHTGLDIANKSGTPVTPFRKGVIVYADEIFWGYGKHVVIDHGGNLTSTYAHLDKILVEKGQEVTPGDVIGLVGSTGWSTGPHLHFQVNYYGIPVNPRVFLGNTL